MDRPGIRQVPEGSGEQGRMEKTGCKIICGATTTLGVKGLIMMMMMIACKKMFTLEKVFLPRFCTFLCSVPVKSARSELVCVF